MIESKSANFNNLLSKKVDKLQFEITHKSSEAKLMRTGIIHTPHGSLVTPAFITVGTKATVKALTVEDVKKSGSPVVLANTYHLFLEPGSEIVRTHGGFAKMMNWVDEQGVPLPTMTDSGGFQVFSLGAAFDTGVSKIATSKDISEEKQKDKKPNGLTEITEDGVWFKSLKDGQRHFISPEISMQVQHDLGADMFFAFDECTSPLASREYQIEALKRTSRWAKRCIDEHKRLGLSGATGKQQALFGVVQGGGYEDLRKMSACELGAMDFDGFGIGGSFTKDDMGVTVKSATENLPEGKPRHLLGIGEPIDFFIGVEFGIDTFDCVSPTRVARHGNIYSPDGRLNLLRSEYKTDYSKCVEDSRSPLYPYTKSYLAHLYRSNEMLASTLASMHNVWFLNNLMNDIRASIVEGRFFEFKKEFCDKYYSK